ncbi:MAG TPA: MFS transporter [Chloroflexota bacterium]|nr:MFS transporter [Chloroflexota bacterium]
MTSVRRTRLPLAALMGANAVSFVGNVLTSIAVPWFVLQTTGSATQMGITAFFTALPIVVASFFGGAVVDRLGFRYTSIFADVTSGAVVAVIPLLYHTVGLAFWQLLVLVLLRGLCNAPGSTAREALAPDLADLAGVRLERAITMFEAIQRGSVLIGAPLGGVLIGLLTPSNVLWGDAASFVVSAVLVWLMVPAPTLRPRDDTPRRYLAQLIEGLRYIRSDRLILTIVSTVMITNLLDAALGDVVIPVYVKRIFGSALDLGLIDAAFGLGAIVGTVLFLIYGHTLAKRPTLIIAFTLVGMRAWILASYPSLPLILAAMTVLGLAVAPVNPILMTAGYQRIPLELRARVLGALTAGVFAGIPLGGLLGGFLIAVLGMRAALILIGTCYVLTTLSLLFNRASKELDVPQSVQRSA